MRYRPFAEKNFDTSRVRRSKVTSGAPRYIGSSPLDANTIPCAETTRNLRNVTNRMSLISAGAVSPGCSHCDELSARWFGLRAALIPMCTKKGVALRDSDGCLSPGVVFQPATRPPHEARSCCERGMQRLKAFSHGGDLCHPHRAKQPTSSE
jgi:hypothetical protein